MVKRLKIEDYLVLLLWVGIALYGSAVSGYSASTIVFYILNVPMALGLAMLWGFAGILSFGQVAFFGVAGYTYGVIAGNIVSNPALASWAGIAGGVGAAILLALVFGYFLFYGRVEAWIIPIVTLVMTLILATFMGQTAGYEWRVGQVLLGGYNGMTNIPSMHIFGSDLFGKAFFYYVVVAVVICWLITVLCVRSRFGDVLIAFREDSARTELYGHDIRFLQLLSFSVSAILSGVSGVLYVQWSNYITPDSMGLLQATLPIVWVAVGGRTSLLGVVVATLVLNILSFQLSSSGNQYAFVILGVLLVASMVLPTLGWVQRLARFVRRKMPGETQ